MKGKILEALRQAAERLEYRGNVAWGLVYLDNARPGDCTAHQFAGYLSALTKDGLYQDEPDPEFKGVFGRVRMELCSATDQPTTTCGCNNCKGD